MIYQNVNLESFITGLFMAAKCEKTQMTRKCLNKLKYNSINRIFLYALKLLNNEGQEYRTAHLRGGYSWEGSK
jgi:hypothetical protein